MSLTAAGAGDRLLRSLRRLAAALTRLERQIAAQNDVSVSQLRCLLSLLDGGGEAGLRVSDLADGQALAISTMTRNTALLERRGLVVRGDDGEDGRAVRLLLTDSGRQLADLLHQSTMRRFSDSFREFHPSDRVERAVALERVATALERTLEA